ncbi:hypothetical protein U1Q18_047376, partial [Sarracenia purpurea var. burkii]
PRNLNADKKGKKKMVEEKEQEDEVQVIEDGEELEFDEMTLVEKDDEDSDIDLGDNEE